MPRLCMFGSLIPRDVRPSKCFDCSCGRRFEGDEDIKRSLSDLWCAVSGDQRTLGILSSKMEDAVRDFSRLLPGSLPEAILVGSCKV